MKPTNKQLGAAAMLAAPFLLLEFYVNSRASVRNTSLGGVCDLAYMLGWLCSIAGFWRMQATGSGKAGAALLYLQAALLCIACGWNVWVIVDPLSNSRLFAVLDFFWPLSNVWLLVIGIGVAVTGRLRGWRRYTALAAGCWFPVCFGVMGLMGQNEASFYIGGLYSTLAWGWMGWTIYSTDETHLRAAPVAA